MKKLTNILLEPGGIADKLTFQRGIQTWKYPNRRKGRPKYEWFNGWTDEELLSADYLGVYHREDKDKNKPVCAAVDFDDKKYVAHDWNIKLPPSMSVVKDTKAGRSTIIARDTRDKHLSDKTEDKEASD